LSSTFSQAILDGNILMTQLLRVEGKQETVRLLPVALAFIQAVDFNFTNMKDWCENEK